MYRCDAYSQLLLMVYIIIIINKMFTDVNSSDILGNKRLRGNLKVMKEMRSRIKCTTCYL